MLPAFDKEQRRNEAWLKWTQLRVLRTSTLVTVFCTGRWNCFSQHPNCDRLLLQETATVLEYHRVMMFLLHASAGSMTSNVKRDVACEIRLGVWGVIGDPIDSEERNWIGSFLSFQHTSVTVGVPPRVWDAHSLGTEATSCSLSSCLPSQSLFHFRTWLAPCPIGQVLSDVLIPESSLGCLFKM